MEDFYDIDDIEVLVPRRSHSLAHANAQGLSGRPGATNRPTESRPAFSVSILGASRQAQAASEEPMSKPVSGGRSAASPDKFSMAVRLITVSIVLAYGSAIAWWLWTAFGWLA